MTDALLTIAAAVPGFLLSSARNWTGVGAALTVVVPILLLGITQWVLISKRGQSLGKWAVGIRIIREDGAPLGFVRGVLMRSWLFSVVSSLPSIGTVITLADYLSIFGRQRRCLHDRLAGTKVVVALPQRRR